jgi:hypothetical protein
MNTILYLPAKSHQLPSHKLDIIEGEAISCLRITLDNADRLKAI